MKKGIIFSSLILSGTLLFSGNALAQQAQRQQGQQQNPMAWQQEVGQGQSASLTIAPSTVRQIQLRLNQQGFDPGNVDGQWGQSTSSALANFQRSMGLEPTGQINLNTLQALGIGLGGQSQQHYGAAPQFGGGGQQGQMQGGQFQQQPQQFQQQPQQFQQQPQQFQQQPQYRQQYQQQPQFQGGQQQ